jgi:hypothetical protein
MGLGDNCMNIVAKIIHRADREEGLLDSNFISLISENPNKYLIKEQGIKLLNTINENISLNQNIVNNEVIEKRIENFRPKFTDLML